MRLAEGIVCRSFGTTGGEHEHFIIVQAPAELDFGGQMAALEDRYRQALQALGLSPQSSVFRRIFLSDVLNQAAFIRETPLFDASTAVSVVQQAPLSGAKIGLLAYHVQGPAPMQKHRLSPKHLLIERKGLRHLWSTRLCTSDHETSNSAEKQTREIFAELIDTLAGQGATLRDHCVRTWIYVKDVDVFYKGMVDSRRGLFRDHGLTADTHYIASTGIEGACSHRWDLVSMDAYSLLDLRPGQMSYLNDFDRLCATKDYNVTFERGTCIAFADRAHHFISGTASIDRRGDVLYPGEVIRQLERALENVEALLRSGDASLGDMMYLLVYLRDPADAHRVESYLDAHCPDLPRLIVQGAVCRPAWLIEVEGVAVARHADPAMPSF
jgi:enamine deaminase RidA (YjgF/YER057c/UK114 family)